MLTDGRGLLISILVFDCVKIFDNIKQVLIVLTFFFS